MFLEFRTEVEDALVSALETFGLPTADLGIEEPPEGIDAVLASSAAFRLADHVDGAPPSVASDIAAEITAGDYTYLDAVVVQGPYVNFLPGDRYYEDTLTAAQSSQYGRLDERDERVIVEHTSANPTGPIHVGRARNPILGDAIVRVLDLAGYDVAAHYYVNDAGRQIAVFTWAFETFDEGDLPEPARDRIEYDLVRYYRKGSDYLETADPHEIEQAEAEIRSIMRGLEEGNESVYERVSTVVDQVLGGMQACLERLPAEFDEFVKETRFLRNGDTRRVIERLQGLDAASVADDAWHLDLRDFGVENEFVFLRSDGTSLYATRDLAHHEWKLSQADRAITVLGEDHKLQADQLTATLELLGNDPNRVDQVFYSWVNLPEGGMSTREGTGIALDDLLDEAIDRAREEVESRLDSRIRDDELGEDDIARIARQVGIGAVRFDIVAKQPTKGITFRWEDALDFEAQSAPYVQYVHARCCGILEGGTVPDTPSARILTEPEEQSLLGEIARFPAVVETAALDLEPHLVATYTRDFAESFNAFYRECPVLQADTDVRDARLALVQAARHTVANALWALGVEAPDSM